MFGRSDVALETDAAHHETLALEHMAQAEACIAEIRRRLNAVKIPLGVTGPLLEACRVIETMRITDKNAIRFILTEALKPPVDLANGI